MKTLKTIFSTLTIATFLASNLFGTAETLPKKVYSFQNTLSRYSIDKIGVIEPDSNTKKWVSPSDYKLKHIPVYAGYTDYVDWANFRNIQIADYYTVQEHNIDFGVGITNKLTIGVTLPLIQKTLKYTDEYVAATKELEALDPDNNIVAPNYARANGIGDITLGFKYRISKPLAFAVSYKGGILNTGTDEKEKRYKDGIEELKTGTSATLITHALFYDMKIGKHLIEWTAAYEKSDVDYEYSLDNNFYVDRGDTYTLDALSNLNLTKTISLTPQLTYIVTEKDAIRNEVTNRYEVLDNSDSQTLLTGLTLKYSPVEFFNIFVGYTYTAYQKLAVSDTRAYTTPSGSPGYTNGAYDFPGRLGINSFIKFGATLYLQ